ncbi:hypothetical protein OSH10_05100 [Kaistia defluvii]|uniref:hypothetical protein n=1 Tax=Kaistia defluvii TaxID=410841 RepID=UPI002254178E|nr:hypothetical protein [Kaistia defluvii]MCX5517804.1 hypothetical protein [Kaistia defluvii]
MSIHPKHQQFSLGRTRAAIETEAERLASLLAETERDLTRLLAVLDWMDGDNDNEPEPADGDADAEPSLAAPERQPRPGGRGRDYACGQIAWAAGGDSDREVEGG